MINKFDVAYRSIQFDETAMRFSTFGSTWDRYNNVYHKENFKAFENRDGPGPGKYNDGYSFSKTLSTFKYSFPKDLRRVSDTSPKKCKNLDIL